MKFDIKFYIPYLGSLVVLLGYIKLSIFYNLFGIDISTFLDITEFFTLFLKDIILISVFLIAGIAFMFLIQSKSEFDDNSKRIHSALSENKLIKRLNIYLTTGFNFYFIAPIILVGLILVLIINRSNLIVYLLFVSIYIIPVLLKIILFEIRRQYHRMYGKYISIMIYNFVSLIIVLVFYVVISAFTEYNDVRYNQAFSGTQIQLSDTLVKSNDNCYFIGKTKNYVFFYNNTEEQAEIYFASEIKKLSIRKN